MRRLFRHWELKLAALALSSALWIFVMTSEKAEVVTHDRMKAGQSCGKCHGKQAFNFDDCTMCHKM